MPIMRPLVKDGQGWHDVLGPIHNKTSQSASFELNDTILIMVKKSSTQILKLTKHRAISC